MNTKKFEFQHILTNEKKVVVGAVNVKGTAKLKADDWDWEAYFEGRLTNFDIISDNWTVEKISVNAVGGKPQDIGVLWKLWENGLSRDNGCIYEEVGDKIVDHLFNVTFAPEIADAREWFESLTEKERDQQDRDDKLFERYHDENI